MKPDYLKRCWQDGQFLTEGVTDFWSRKFGDGPDLGGERLTVGSEVACLPVKFTGQALLVCLTDIKGRDWFSWVWAEPASEPAPKGGTQYLLPIPRSSQE